jgi:CHRD domain
MTAPGPRGLPDDQTKPWETPRRLRPARFARHPGLQMAAAAAASVAIAVGVLVATASASPHQPGGPAMPKAMTPAPAMRVPAAAGYSFATLDGHRDPAFNQLLGINDRGKIAGYSGSGAAGHPNRGYQILPPYGQSGYTAENYPGAVQTQVTGLDDRGVSVGFFSRHNHKNQVNDNSGFYAQAGAYHQVSFPTANQARPPVTQLLGVNDHRVAVGFYTNGQGVSRGFRYDIATRQFSRVLLPGLPNLSRKMTLTATAISNTGAVAGFYSVAGGATDGFLLAGQHLTRLAYPGAAMTQPLGVNSRGEIAGAYLTGRGADAATHGFTWTAAAGFRTVDVPGGAGATTINGVNDRGELVGFYTSRSGRTHGFLAAPARRRALDLAPMPAGAVTLGRGGGGQLTAVVTGYGFTPGSSHAVQLTVPGQSRPAAAFTTLTANATGQVSAMLTSSYTGPTAAGSRLVVRAGRDGAGAGGPVAQTAPLTASGTGRSMPLHALGTGPGGSAPHGRATVTYDPAARTLTVTVDASGLSPGPHAAHIHAGSCASQGGVRYMLMDLEADAQGRVVHQTRVISGVRTPIPAAGWYLNLHQGSSQTILAHGQPAVAFRPLLCSDI